MNTKIWCVCVCCSFTRPQMRGARPVTAEKLFSNKKCLAWFQAYAGPDKVVGPDAMEKFCEDIGVEPENVSPPPPTRVVLKVDPRTQVTPTSKLFMKLHTSARTVTQRDRLTQYCFTAPELHIWKLFIGTKGVLCSTTLHFHHLANCRGMTRETVEEMKSPVHMHWCKSKLFISSHRLSCWCSPGI